ncbi:phosphatase PAP2 family protein [Candidatus Micrarchaeota archaeon]|nr:phosphatase PAP2 family protein [Candidatus Micrarchaeota archaeon]MBU1930261.1 phosphatase PAP2 family protein [Candidatus Micrarchaeota archaeon]
MFEAIQSFDNAFLHGIQNIFVDPLTSLFAIITLLGHPGVWVVIATLLYWNNREKNAFFLVNVLVFASVITGVLKVLIARPRPDPSIFKVATDPIGLEKLQQGINYSFPSGHTTTVTTLVSYYATKYKKSILLGMGIIAVILVALSRMVLGLHFLSDVMVAIIIGLIIGKVVWKAQESLQQHHFRLTKLEAEAGFVILLIVALVLMFFLENLALISILLGFYAGFFLATEFTLKQRTLHFRLKVIKSVVGLLVLGLILAPALSLANGTIAFGLLFLTGFWVSFLYPWLFEKAVSHPTSQ